MIKELKAIKQNRDLFQLDMHKTKGLPYAMYYTEISKFIGRRIPMHWHNEAVVFTVVKGNIKVHINTLGEKRQIDLQEGEGAFINENVIHGFTTDDDKSTLIMLVFDLSLITGSCDNILSRRYLDPIRANQKMKYIILNNSYEWHKENMIILKDIYRNIKNNNFWFELIVREKLTRLIMNIVENMPGLRSYFTHDNLVTDDSLYQMMTYINTHYQEKISVKNIAESANVSARACYRKFNQYLSTTPVEVLRNVRMKKALELLDESNKTVTEISHCVGFGDSSYFTKLFRELMNCTPTKYRDTKA